MHCKEQPLHSRHKEHTEREHIQRRKEPEHIQRRKEPVHSQRHKEQVHSQRHKEPVHSQCRKEQDRIRCHIRRKDRRQVPEHSSWKRDVPSASKAVRHRNHVGTIHRRRIRRDL